MKNFLRRALLVVLTIFMVGESSIIPNTISAASKESKVTVNEYLKSMIEIAKLEVNSTDKDPYAAAALKAGLIKEDEITSYTVPIKKEDAAVIANRADELLHGTTYNEDLYKQIKHKKRLSDLSSITGNKQDSVIKVFSKGIMIGASNGLYTHSRKFNGKEALTVSEAKAIVARVKTPSKRRKLSPDGQLIRTTNLPKGNKNQSFPKTNKEYPYTIKHYPNYKDYPYILESFPNSFYERTFLFSRVIYSYRPVALDDYASPAQMAKIKYFDPDYGYTLKDVLDNHLDDWAQQVETNLKTRLNVDYRTVDSKWINTLRKTYYIYDSTDMNNRKTKDIKKYVALMKKNKVVVQGTVSVEPSTLYYKNGYYMRAYVKFKVNCQGNYDSEYIFGGAFSSSLKKNQWKTAYVDIKIGSSTGGNTGDDFAVFDDYID